MENKGFLFELGQNVTITVSGEKGAIGSRMESSNSANQYRVAYKAADGRAVDNWFYESELDSH